MKTKSLWLMAAVTLAAFSSCSNNDETPVEAPEGKTFSEMTIKLASPTTYAVSTPEGTESNLTKTLIFVKTKGDTGNEAAAYKLVELNAGVKQTTVKFPENASTVFVFANLPTTVETEVKACTTEDQFLALQSEIVKSYISGLNSTNGSFIMSGKAVINNAAGVSPYTLPITLNREVAKVSFNVKQIAIDKLTDLPMSKADNILLKVTNITVNRATSKIAPFKMDGGNTSGYTLPWGVGDTNYNMDTDATNIAPSADATDYTFNYPFGDVQDQESYIFNPFYVLPNYATKASTGTVIILEASIKTTANAAGETRYYKARVSNDLTSYLTAKNTHYIITASVKGEGAETPNPEEDQKNDLIVTISVADWGLILSDQILGE